ncbi:C40 family peptidase [Pedobacter cryophilus]|uniref:C40 family peptidase n=1 Tax=Pedobacter cryophilus TaxID=2571271 RepID=UPI00145F502A|nr:NlpC/P60 family protein [Pedobacter cryophilus]
MNKIIALDQLKTTKFNLSSYIKLVFLFILFALAITSCKSKKVLVPKSGFEKPSPKIVKKYSELMDVSKKAIRNGKLYGFIDDWQGTKYQYGGLSKRGVDCSGLVYLAFKDVYEKEIPRITSQQVEAIKRKYEGQLKEGDLVFFDYEGKKFSHVGIYLQNGFYFHASTSKGVMVAKLKDPYTYKYFSRGGTVK